MTTKLLGNYLSFLICSVAFAQAMGDGLGFTIDVDRVVYLPGGKGAASRPRRSWRRP